MNLGFNNSEKACNRLTKEQMLAALSRKRAVDFDIRSIFSPRATQILVDLMVDPALIELDMLLLETPNVDDEAIEYIGFLPEYQTFRQALAETIDLLFSFLEKHIERAVGGTFTKSERINIKPVTSLYLAVEKLARSQLLSEFKWLLRNKGIGEVEITLKGLLTFELAKTIKKLQSRDPARFEAQKVAFFFNTLDQMHQHVNSGRPLPGRAFFDHASRASKIMMELEPESFRELMTKQKSCMRSGLFSIPIIPLKDLV